MDISTCSLFLPMLLTLIAFTAFVCHGYIRKNRCISREARARSLEYFSFGTMCCLPYLMTSMKKKLHFVSLCHSDKQWGERLNNSHILHSTKIKNNNTKSLAFSIVILNWNSFEKILIIFHVKFKFSKKSTEIWRQLLVDLDIWSNSCCLLRKPEL